MKVIEVFNVSKWYGNVHALKNLSFDVGPSEIYGLLGPNGAGKTTMLKILVGLLSPDSGQVKIMGIEIKNNRVDALKNVGYVPEDPYLFQNLTVTEFLQYIGRLRDVPKDVLTERIEHYLSVFELAEKKDALIRSLSRGMIQKVTVASAIIHSPRVLIMDEPMVNMDPQSQHVFKEEVRKLVSEGATVLISSHILDMVERFCTKVGIINEGVMLAEGTIEDLRKVAHSGEDATLEDVFIKLLKGE